MKRLLALILCLVMCLSLVPAAGAEGDAPNTTDTTAPTVSNITLSATTVNAPGSLTVSVTATDNLSGVSSIQVEFYNKETESYLYAHPQLESSGLFAGTLNIGQYTNAGKYVIRSVYITDKAGNSKWYYGEGAKQASEESKLPAKCYSLAFDVVDPEAFPSITTQPQSKTAATGATVKFTVKASNATGYQWYFRKSASDSWSKCSNASSSSLSVEALSYRSGYQYRCKVSNDVGSVYSNAATLTVMNPPSVTTQPQNKTVSVGASASFTVKASGSSLSYQWQFRKSASDSWSNCSNGTSATFSVEAKTYRDGYQYRCKVSNAVGTVYSSAATLRVKPAITTQPKAATVPVGSRASFTVKAEGATSYQWQFRKSADAGWSSCSDGTGAAFSVEAKTYRDGYQYRCKVTNAAGSVYSNAATLRVTPAITTQPQSVTVSAGGIASFTVITEGATSYQWQFLKPDSEVWSNCSNGTSATLTVEAKHYRNGYRYRCLVRNAAGTTISEAAYLWVS